MNINDISIYNGIDAYRVSSTSSSAWISFDNFSDTPSVSILFNNAKLVFNCMATNDCYLNHSPLIFNKRRYSHVELI